MNPVSLLLQGLLLGLASGMACLASCAPVLLPVLLTGNGTLRRQSTLLLEFLGGRLLGYLLFATIAWLAGVLAAEHFTLQPRLQGLILCGLALLLFLHANTSTREQNGERCLVSPWTARRWLRKVPQLLPSGLGFLSGLNLCAPFLVALTQGAASGSFLGSLLFFAAFFAGTSLFFLPAPLLGLLKKRESLLQVGRFAAYLAAAYYLLLALPLFFRFP